MCPSSEYFRRTRPVTDDFEVVTRKVSGSSYDPDVSWEDYASSYMEFTDTAPTVFHAVDYLARKLEENGFVYLNERDSWDEQLEEHSRFYTIRNGTSILAFVKGKNWRPSNGAAIIGTHIDSLTCVVKPVSIKSPIDNFELIGVAPYGGGLSDLWWDRDLGIGGRLVLKDSKSHTISTKLVRIPHPVARIASLAPHFGQPSLGPFNPETQKVPFIGLAADPNSPEAQATADEKRSPVVGKHSLRLLRALAKEAHVSVADIIEVELNLYDTHPSTLAGLDKEFLFAPRIDDKSCTFTAVFSLIEAAEAIEKGDTLGITAAYEYEEVGSRARTGAQGNLLDSVVQRVLGEKGDTIKGQFWANSFLLSADVSHAANPNFDNVYLEHHKPLLNKGLTLCRDPNGNMIADSLSSALVEEVARRTGNTLQLFQIRNDSRSGGTIGPSLAANTGVRGVDIGISQLSMHSVRAAIGSKDIWLAVRFFKSFFQEWRKVDTEFKLGDL